MFVRGEHGGEGKRGNKTLIPQHYSLTLFISA